MKKIMLLLFALMMLLCSCVRIAGDPQNQDHASVPNGVIMPSSVYASVTQITASVQPSSQIQSEPIVTVPATSEAVELPSDVPTESSTVVPTEPPTTAPTEPPTTAPTEPAPPPEPDDEDMVRVIDFIPTIRQELIYATEENFTGQVIYRFEDAYLRYGTVKRLAEVCEELAEKGLGLLIWDGFRPVAAQQKLWDICPDPAFVSHPETGNRSHCRGSAVDVTLVDLKTGEEMEMPSDFDEFSALGDRDYSDCSDAAAANALLLERIMEKYGFEPYDKEWWHFSDCDDYEVNEDFDPSWPMIWTADCNQYINLRDKPGGKVLAKIPKGSKMQLVHLHGQYARVIYGGTAGYVHVNYILPAEGEDFTGLLDTVVLTDRYTPEQMEADMAALAQQYPELVTVENIGYSELGRPINVIRIGSPDAEHHVLLHGAIHGREHMTACILMAMAEYWLDGEGEAYSDVCLHIIPMINPDGVVISQTEVLTDEQKLIYQSDLNKGYTRLSEAEYARRWKANGLGVDLNRNFPAGWGKEGDREDPSSELYPGIEAFSALETQILRDYTLRYSFDSTISYHATGSVIYCDYGDKAEVNRRSAALGNAVSTVTGYYIGESTDAEGAGYKDWVMDELEIPSLTIEIGVKAAPMAAEEAINIFARNRNVLRAIADWLRTESGNE